MSWRSPAGTRVAAGNFATVYDRFIDRDWIVIPTPADLCDRPIEGKYTKHFSRSFNLSVTIGYWCPTWTNPFRWCTKTVTIAGVTVSLGLEVGYRITCCGAIAWGQAYAQACVSVLGQSVCAGCSARVIGLAGISRTGSGSSCSYGLGVSAEAQVHGRRRDGVLRERAVRLDDHRAMPTGRPSLQHHRVERG